MNKENNKLLLHSLKKRCLRKLASAQALPSGMGTVANKLVAITDTLSDITAVQAATEQFNVIDNASYGQTLRGVSFAPSSKPVSEPVTILGSVMAMGIGGLMKKKYAQKLRLR